MSMTTGDHTYTLIIIIIKYEEIKNEHFVNIINHVHRHIIFIRFLFIKWNWWTAVHHCELLQHVIDSNTTKKKKQIKTFRICTAWKFRSNNKQKSLFSTHCKKHSNRIPNLPTDIFFNWKTTTCETICEFRLWNIFFFFQIEI